MGISISRSTGSSGRVALCAVCFSQSCSGNDRATKVNGTVYWNFIHNSLVGGSMKFRSPGIAAAGMALLAVSAFAQITTIEGVAKGPDGKPIEKAEVIITRTDIKGSYKTKTDKKGHYLYMGLPMGTYTIDLMVDGKKMD